MVSLVSQRARLSLWGGVLQDSIVVMLTSRRFQAFFSGAVSSLAVFPVLSLYLHIQWRLRTSTTFNASSGQRGTFSAASAQSLLVSPFQVPFAWSQALGSPWLSARPPPAYHLSQSSGRGGKWDTNEIQSETKSGGVANCMEEGDRI